MSSQWFLVAWFISSKTDWIWVPHPPLVIVTVRPKNIPIWWRFNPRTFQPCDILKRYGQHLFEKARFRPKKRFLAIDVATLYTAHWLINCLAGTDHPWVGVSPSGNVWVRLSLGPSGRVKQALSHPWQEMAYYWVRLIRLLIPAAQWSENRWKGSMNVPSVIEPKIWALRGIVLRAVRYLTHRKTAYNYDGFHTYISS